MTSTKPEDWTADVIARFWGYTSTRPHRRRLYFSRLAGDGIALFLHLRGVLSGTLLDFGCGPGFLFDHLAGYPVECWGVEPSQESVAQINQRCRAIANFREAVYLSGDDPLKGRKFDVVTCVETLEHVPAVEVPAFLAALRRVVKPGGALVITTPHDERLEEGMIYCPFCEREFHHMQHLQSFTEGSLTSLLRANGFEVSYCRGIDIQRFCDEARRPARLATVSARARYHMARLFRWRETSAQRLERLSSPGPHLVAVAHPRSDSAEQ